MRYTLRNKTLAMLLVCSSQIFANAVRETPEICTPPTWQEELSVENKTPNYPPDYKYKTLADLTLESDFYGSALIGFYAGYAGSLLLIVKDGCVGVLIPGGPEFHGSQRILPLLTLMTFSTVSFGLIGSYFEINLAKEFP